MSGKEKMGRYALIGIVAALGLAWSLPAAAQSDRQSQEAQLQTILQGMSKNMLPPKGYAVQVRQTTTAVGPRQAQAPISFVVLMDGAGKKEITDVSPATRSAAGQTAPQISFDILGFLRSVIGQAGVEFSIGSDTYQGKSCWLITVGAADKLRGMFWIDKTLYVPWQMRAESEGQFFFSAVFDYEQVSGFWLLKSAIITYQTGETVTLTYSGNRLN